MNENYINGYQAPNGLGNPGIAAETVDLVARLTSFIGSGNRERRQANQNLVNELHILTGLNLEWIKKHICADCQSKSSTAHNQEQAAQIISAFDQGLLDSRFINAGSPMLDQILSSPSLQMSPQSQFQTLQPEVQQTSLVPSGQSSMDPLVVGGVAAGVILLSVMVARLVKN